MQCFIKNGRRYFPALIGSIPALLSAGQFIFVDHYRRAMLSWAPANFRGVVSSCGSSGSTTRSGLQFFDPFGRPRCRGVIARPRFLGGTSTETTEFAEDDTEARPMLAILAEKVSSKESSSLIGAWRGSNFIGFISKASSISSAVFGDTSSFRVRRRWFCHGTGVIGHGGAL